MEKHNHIDMEKWLYGVYVEEITITNVGRIRKNVIHFS